MIEIKLTPKQQKPIVFFYKNGVVEKIIATKDKL